MVDLGVSWGFKIPVIILMVVLGALSEERKRENGRTFRPAPSSSYWSLAD